MWGQRSNCFDQGRYRCRQAIKRAKQAQKDQVRRIDWNVLDWNKPAIDFYEKTGAKVLKEWHVAQMDEEGIANFMKNRVKQN